LRDSVPGVLEGIRVIDLTVWFQGPVAAQHLADFGAEVIKVERPQGGDQGRGVISVKTMPTGDWNQYFLVINRNKKSLALNLKEAEGQAILHRLVEKSDVFLSNLSPAALEGWNLGYEKLAALNPGIVYATNTGYGTRGEVDKPSFDMTVQALSGLMPRLGEPGQPPVYLGVGSGDAYGGMMSALGILLALRRRRQTGRGQRLDASLYGAQLFLAAPMLQGYLATGSDHYAKQRSRREVPNPLWNLYPAQDGWLSLCLENSDAAWRRLCGSLDSPRLEDDARFASSDARCENAPALVDALDAVLRGRPAADWVAAWQALDIPVSPVRTFEELEADPQVWENDYLLSTWCEAVQREVKVRGLPVGLSETPGQVVKLGPELGEHTELLLTELLGYSWDEVAELKRAGAIP